MKAIDPAVMREILKLLTAVIELVLRIWPRGQ